MTQTIGDDFPAQTFVGGRAIAAIPHICAGAADAMRRVIADIFIAAPYHVVGNESPIGEGVQRLHRAAHHIFYAHTVAA